MFVPSIEYQLIRDFTIKYFATLHPHYQWCDVIERATQTMESATGDDEGKVATRVAANETDTESLGSLVLPQRQSYKVSCWRTAALTKCEEMTLRKSKTPDRAL